MHRSVAALAVPVAGALLLTACAKKPTIPEPTPEPPAPVQCAVHTPVATHFKNATEDWSLGKSGLAVVGNRLAAGDLDGDGFPDLLVHAVSSNKRELVGTPPKLVWALMNRPKPGGGRHFVDATLDSGLFQVRGGSTTELRAAHLVVLGDLDNDGDLDAFSGTYTDPTKPATDPGDRSEVLLNDGKGHFTLAAPSAARPAANQLWPTTAASLTDYDRDGRLDLFVGFFYESYGTTYQGLQAQLYRGQGDGSFVTMTEDVGLKTQPDGFDEGKNHRPAYGVTSCDLDGDGAPELLVSAYGRQWNLLYQNDGAGRFTEVGQASGFAGDAERDFSDNQFFACYCTVHRSQPECANVPNPVVASCGSPADRSWAAGIDDQPWRLNGNTFSTYCSDVDGDGKLDLYNAEIVHWHIGKSSDNSGLLLSKSTPGAILFERPGNDSTGLVWPHPPSWNEGGLMVAGGDLDGDAREDLIVAASDYPDNFGLVFHQLPNRKFEEVGADWGLRHACLSGLAIADFDRDGDLDAVVGSGTARDCANTWKSNEVHLYENTATPKGWLEVRLAGDGVTANRSAIGARVTVSVMGESFVKELQGGYGHMAMRNDDLLHFGLGDCPAVDSIAVRWPDKAGTVQRFEHVEVNRVIELRQGDPGVHPVTLGP